MTSGMRHFARGLADGLSGTQAAIQAGYSPHSARSRASKLRRHPDVRRAIERLQAGDDPFDTSRYDDPLDLLCAVTVGDVIVTRVQLAAVIALLPYHHARPR